MPLLTLALALFVFGPATPQTRTDFSGTWTFDEPRSSATLPGGHVVIAKLLGDEVTITQTAKEMRLVIRINGATVDAVYAVDGSESRNVSSEPGKPDVTVTSRSSWEDGKLIVRSTSTSTVQGRPVTTETKRVFWIDLDGNLILDRSGTPVSEVPASRSVYKKVRGSAISRGAAEAAEASS